MSGIEKTPDGKGYVLRVSEEEKLETYSPPPKRNIVVDDNCCHYKCPYRSEFSHRCVLFESDIKPSGSKHVAAFVGAFGKKFYRCEKCITWVNTLKGF